MNLFLKQFSYIKKLYDTHSREQKVRLLKSKRFSLFHASISQKQIIEHFSPDFAFWYYARFSLDFPLSFWLYVMSGEKRKNGSRECDDKIYTCILSESIKKPSPKWSPLKDVQQNLLAPLKSPPLLKPPDFKQCHKSLCKVWEKCANSSLTFCFPLILIVSYSKIGRISAIKLSWQVTNIRSIHLLANLKM